MARWELCFEIDPKSTSPLFLQIAAAIADDVRKGRLRPGAPLPGARALARTLRVNRNTIAAAYDELVAEGWVTTSTGRGTFVSQDLPDLPQRTAVRGPDRSRARIGFTLPTAKRRALHDEAVRSGTLKWDFGIPDIRLAPVDELARAYRRALRDHGRRLLEYDRYDPEPHSRLQTALASMLRATRSLHVEPDQIVITRGSQMALYLVARAVLRPGDVIVVEHPGYDLAWEVFRRLGARIIPVEVDELGLRVDQLERLTREIRVRAVFVTPHHQFPTTVSLSQGRRIELLRFAERARVAVIEDDYDHEFHYDGRPLLPLSSADSAGVVIYIGSLSKLFAPGLRLGYLVGPRALVRAAQSLRELIDIQSDRVLDWAVAELFDEGEIQRHLNRARRIYKERRDVLVELLRGALAGVVQMTVPSGGMALWGKVDPSVNVERWADRARSAGLIFRTGRIFFLEARPRPFLRLGFTRWNEAELSSAVQRLAEAVPVRPVARRRR